MADGRHDGFNVTPNRGRKLRNQGSNPTGTQTMSFKPEFSDEQDYENLTHLNSRTRARNAEHGAGHGEVSDCCMDLGLNLKEPLT